MTVESGIFLESLKVGAGGYLETLEKTYFNPEIVAREHVDGARVARCQLALVHGPHELRTCIKLICHGGESERLVIGVRPERILLGYSAATTILNDCALDSRSHNIHDLVVSILQQFG